MFDKLVGEAYVLMRADGRLLKRDLQSAGRQGAIGYSQAFQKELDAATKVTVRRFQQGISKGIAEIDFSSFLREFGTIEDTVGGLTDRMDELARRGKINTTQYQRFADALAEWSAEAIIARRQSEELERSLTSYSAVFDKTLKGQWEKFAKDLALASQAGDFSKLRGETERVDAFMVRLNDTLVRHRTELGLTGEEYDDIIERLAAWGTAVDDIERRGALNRILDGVEQRRHPVVQALDDIDDRVDILAISIGRAFGKGSRNNFLNWVGSVTAGMARLVTSIPLRLGTTVAQIGTAFSDGFSAARAAGLTRFAAAGKGLASIFAGKGGVAGAIVAAGVAAVGFGKILPAIASAVSMLAANAISLVGSIGVGLTGALLAAGPAAVAAAGGFAILAGAWNSWSESDAGIKALERQKAAFDDFFETLYPAIAKFNDVWADAFLGLGEAVAPGINDLANRLTALFDQRSTQSNLDAWGNSITEMFNDISRTVASLTEGIIAFFVPILPYAERLTEAIADMADRFAEWATSASGQNSIADFMDRAWKAASALWDLLREVGELIGTVFDVGADETGTGWIQGMADSLAEFNDYLKSPAGRDAIEGWFADAKQFGEDVGNVIGSLVGIFEKLDSPEGRKTATDILDAVKGIASFTEDIADLATDVGAVVDGVIALASPLKIVTDLLSGDGVNLDWLDELTDKDVSGKFEEMKESISSFATDSVESLLQWSEDAKEAVFGFFTGVGESIGTFFSEGPERFRTWASETWAALLEGFAEGGEAVMVWLAEWLEGLAVAITEFDLGEFAANLLTSIQDGLGQAAQAIAVWTEETLAAIGSWRDQQWARFSEWATGIPGQMAGGLGSAAGAIVAWAGQTVTTIAVWVGQQRERFTQWMQSIPEIIGLGIARAGAFLSSFPGRVTAWLSSIPSRLSQPFRTAWDRVNQIFDGAPGRLAAAVGRVIGAIAGRLSGVYNAIVSPFQRAWEAVQRIISNISNISIPNPFSGIDLTPWNAAGNIYTGPTVVGVGEAGAEAIVPLDRPLSMVNPNVRALSAIAQGKAPMPGGAGVGSSVTVEAGAVVVTTAATSPSVVGSIVLDEIADVLYAAVG